MAANAITKFITALQSLVRQGLSKQAAEQFAKNEFGEISKFLQKRIDDVYKNPKGEGIENIKIKDEVFDDTVIKLPIDDTGQPFNPNNPLKEYGKPKKAGKGQFTKAEYLIQRLKNTIKENPDDAYVQENFPNFVKEIEANPDLAKNENVFKELGGDLPKDQKITVYDDDTLDFARLKPTKKFQLNKERFQKDFNVADDEVERIIKLSSEDQQKELQKYINKDFKERIELSDYDITDLEPNAEGGRAGYGIGSLVQRKANSNQNQNMPAVDARMNLDYDTLVNQNEAQRTTQAQNRNPFKNIGLFDTQRHFDNNQLLKNAVSRGELSSADYNRLGGFDVAQTMGAGNPVLGGIGNLVGSTAYNAYQSIKDGQPVWEGIKDIARNVQGGAGLISDDLKAQYESIINPTVDQDRISEIVKQQKAAGVPDEGLITNFNKPTMADVAGASSGPTGYTNLRKFYNPFEGRSNLPTSLEEFQSRPGNFEAQIGKRVGYSPTEYYPSFYLDEYGPKTQEGYDSMLADLRNFTLDFGDNPYERDLDSYQFYQYARDDEGNPIGKFTNEEARKEYDEKKAFRQSRYNLGKSQLDNYFNNLSKGGRAGYYTGGMVDVEPNLSDIGHGSDALMARTRLVSPDGQATTSTGLNYLLAEDNDNIRVPFSKGKGVDLLRRGFLKTMGVAGAGIAALKTGLLGLGGKQATKQAAKEIITTPAAAGKPAWFDALVTRVIREGDDVTKTMATKDREIVYRKKIDDETEVMVTQDLDEGVTRIDIDDSTRNVMGYDDPPTVSLQVTDEIVEEGGARIKPEFKATENDYRNYATDPDGGYETELIENTVENTKDLTSDLTKVKSFATNKKETMKEFVESKKRKDNVKYANERTSEYAADRGPDYDPSDYIDDMADDFASGGIARMIGE